MQKLSKGILIAIEGIDGSGKTTLASRLHNQLQSDDYAVVLTKEPGASRLGKQVRAIVQERTYAICPEAEFLLFAADRAQHFNELIIPSLQDHKIVISDRLSDSSLVYQGYARGLDFHMIKTINEWVMHNIKPDITFYIRVSADIAQKRIQERKQALTAFEKEKAEFIQKLIFGFETIYKNRTDVIIIDGNQSIDQVTKQTKAALLQWIQENL